MLLCPPSWVLFECVSVCVFHCLHTCFSPVWMLSQAVTGGKVFIWTHAWEPAEGHSTVCSNPLCFCRHPGGSTTLSHSFSLSLPTLLNYQPVCLAPSRLLSHKLKLRPYRISKTHVFLSFVPLFMLRCLVLNWAFWDSLLRNQLHWNPQMNDLPSITG